MNWAEWARRESASILDAGRWRRVRDLDGQAPHVTLPDGRAVISFASNDYLGLTAHPAVIAGARAALDRWGAGAGSARLIVGSRPIHSKLEEAIADWKEAPAAALFSSGFVANLGVLQTFGTPGTLICSDELNHASIIDGCRLARAEVAIYPHKDVRALKRLLESNQRTIVVTDTVFSMDGDIATLDDVIGLCATYRSLLILDEAHAVLGPLPHLDGVPAIRIGTLSKFLGASGGFAAGPTEFIELIINRARPYIFTTASTPADAGAALAGLQVLQSDEGERLKAALRNNIELLTPDARSPIVPYVIGDERAALDASTRLLEQGFLVPAIRPPSVPQGSARLRVTVSAAHRPEDVVALRAALDTITTTRPRYTKRSEPHPDVVVIAGTDTEVGKTWTAARLITELAARGFAVAARKPVQSFDPGHGTTDAEILAATSMEDPCIVCPPHRWYELAMAPPMAARALNKPPIELRALLAEINRPGESVTLVEGVGGVLSPLADDGDTAALATALKARIVILVAPAGLGTINFVRSAVAALGRLSVLVFLNRFDPSARLHALNLEWLTTVDGYEVCTSIENLCDAVTARLDVLPRPALEVR